MAPGRVLITGATGFVGSALCAELIARGHPVAASVRVRAPALPALVTPYLTGDLSTANDWSAALMHVDTVVHLAARVHVLKETADKPLDAFMAVNRDATMHLARQAGAAGVRRFIFISSIGVNGGETGATPFTEASPPAPHSDYAISKLAAEQALAQYCASSAMELVIIRPPLVYHWNAPGNFERLLRLVKRRVPLPLASVANARSMISLTNLVDLIACCITHPAAAGELFLAADGCDVSTPDLLAYLSEGMNKPSALLPCPPFLLRAGAALLGKQSMYQQLCGSLRVDASKARTMLAWSPPLSTVDGLRSAAQGFIL